MFIQTRDSCLMYFLSVSPGDSAPSLFLQGPSSTVGLSPRFSQILLLCSRALCGTLLNLCPHNNRDALILCFEVIIGLFVLFPWPRVLAHSKVQPACSREICRTQSQCSPLLRSHWNKSGGHFSHPPNSTASTWRFFRATDLKKINCVCDLLLSQQQTSLLSLLVFYFCFAAAGDALWA